MRTILLPMLIAAAACATFGSGPDIKGRYEQGLDAFTAADYGTAISHLDWVGRLRADESIGQRASLLGVGAALDPRNPRRDFGAATAFAIRLRDSGDGWVLHYDPLIAVPFADVTPQSAAAGEAAMWRLYDTIACPTLITRGESSDLLTRETAEEMTRRGPQARLVEFAGVGHAPMFMHDEQISVLRDFLLQE